MNCLIKPKILVLSAYDAASHKYWRSQLETIMPEYQWTQLALPARHFSWRLRGNSLTWSSSNYSELSASYDLIIATSATDITALRGFRPNLGNIPLVVYFHENQFAYPASETKHNLIEIQLTSIYNAWCADRVVFNTCYNKDSFLAGAKKLLNKLPDGIPKDLIKKIEQKTSVIAVGINAITQPNNLVLSRNNQSLNDSAQNFQPISYQPGKSLDLLWNHRWEYDKNPEVFFAAVDLLIEQAIPVRLNVVGQRFRNAPKIFLAAQQKYSDLIDHWGFQSREDYFSLLNQCNLVVSSALHDFQGLAMQEAISRGCVPVAPDRVAYPEYIPNDLLYSTDVKDEAIALADRLAQLFHMGYKQTSNPVQRFSWAHLSNEYRSLIEQLI